MKTVTSNSKSTESLARSLQREFPGVTSYSTLVKLIITSGYEATRKQVIAWQRAGTTAPRRG
jgi:hypothetical protein